MKEISLDYMDVSSSILGKTLFVNPADRYEEPLCVLAAHYVHFHRLSFPLSLNFLIALRFFFFYIQ